MHDTDRTFASVVDLALAELGSEFEAAYEREFEDEEREGSYSGISCATPGNPYVLHCFPPFKTGLTKEHRAHLDIIADKIRRSFSTSRPIAKVTILGHSSTWHTETRDQLELRAIERAGTAREQLILRLARMGLSEKVSVGCDGFADTVPWKGKPYSSTSSTTSAQNDRALNRRVEIHLYEGKTSKPAHTRSQSPHMTPVCNVLGAPWRWVCSVEGDYREEIYPLYSHAKREFDPFSLIKRIPTSGSGIVISPRHVLTAGHVIYAWSGRNEPNDTKTGVVQARNIKVVPARQPFLNTYTLKGPYGVWKVARVHRHESNRLFSYRQPTKDFVADMNNPSSGLRQLIAYDFALLEIEPKGIGKRRRHMGEQNPKDSNTPLGWWCQSSKNAIRITNTETRRQDLANRSVNIAGYPIRNLNWDRMYRGFHHVSGVRGKSVEHGVEAFEGASGGPIWTFDPTRTSPRQLVGMSTSVFSNASTPWNPRFLNTMGTPVHSDLAAFLKKHVPAKYLRFV